MKILTGMLACALALAITGTVTAGCGKMGGGCDNCGKAGKLPDPLRRFQMDTLDLRQEMMNKRFEMQRENLKGSPDNDRIAALKAEADAISARILSIRKQSGLPDNDKRDGECGMIGGCNKAGMGDCNGIPCSGK